MPSDAPTPPPDHLKPEVSDRGFRYLPTITDTYGGTISAYESSAASGPHIWLNVGSGAAHLTLEHARQIADQLNWLADNHWMPGPIPTKWGP